MLLQEKGKKSRQKESQRTGAQNHTPIQQGQGPDQNQKQEQRETEESWGNKEAWLWAGPLKALLACKKHRIKSAGQLQMHQKDKHVKK